MSEANKTTLREAIERCINNRDLSILDRYISPTFVDNRFPDRNGVEGQRRTLGEFLNAFPDFHYSIEDLIAEGDRVVVRYKMSGTHRGEFKGVAPTGKFVSWTGINICRFVDGKVSGVWGEFDAPGLMRQLGVTSTK